jgi:5-methylcytosine-specific restriction enzyme subunit McrC
MAIPIQNIYYLLSYAWDLLDEDEPTLVKTDQGPNLIDLLAYLLQKESLLLFKNGLARQYIRKTEIRQGIKGKLEIGLSLRDNLFRQGKAICTADTLSPDILPNRIIKATLHQLILVPDLQPDIKAGLKRIFSAFGEVRLVSIKTDDFRHSVNQPLFNKHYRRILPICELLLRNLIPEKGGEQYQFNNFLEDERQMSKLFEAFVRNFYTREQAHFSVKSERINWQLTGASTADLHYLPQMKTDISLSSPAKKIIIDTKYYKNALVTHYDKQKLISGHLYQLYAYLKNQDQPDLVKPVAGILLYPVVNQELDLNYPLEGGHQVSIKTINLAQPWQNIKEDLLNMIT